MVPYRNSLVSVHEDANFFREAVLFTARKTDMNAVLVEQDYFCSLLLSYIYQEEEIPIVFKGGTSLSKIYVDFYRLSEDLDFVIPTPTPASRSERRRRIAPFKQWISTIETEHSVFRVAQTLRGHNNSTQYIVYLSYNSVANLNNEPVRIKIEVGLREELLDAPVTKEARTLLMDPFRNEPAISKINVKTLTFRETYAEKLRAALTRKKAAIRDFYDINYAVANLNLNLDDLTLEKYVVNKLKVPYNDPIDISLSRRQDLQSQLETQLKPVLRPRDYKTFNFDKAFDLVAGFGSRIQQYI